MLLFLILNNGSVFSQDIQQGELQAAPPGWKIETIDDGHIIDQLGQHSLAYDSAGNPHVAYGGDHLYHAYRNAGNWVVETVDASPQVGKNASIALDSQDHVYITYYDEVNKDLKYATNWLGSWQVSTVASAGDVGSISYVFASWNDEVPNVSVAYLDATGSNVFYTYQDYWTGGNWEAHEAVDGALNVTSFAMTMWGALPRFSFYAGGAIYYGYYGSGAWQQEMVDPGPCSPVTDIAVDSSGIPYIPIISYVDINFWETYLAYKENGAWKYPSGPDPSNLIYFGQPKPEAVSMSYDPLWNQVFLAMQLPVEPNSLFSDLVVMRGLKDIYDVYKVYPDLVTNAPGERYPSIAVVKDNLTLRGGIVYLYGGALQYRFLSSLDDSGWNSSLSPVDTSSDRGECAVLRVDQTGNLHVMYYRSDNGALLYKVSTPTGWSSTYTITDSGEWATCNDFSRPGMDLDSNGKPVIAYVNFDNQLIYSKWSCVGRDCFTHQVVDSGLNNGFDGSAAIAMGNGDTPFILYHKNRVLTLAYDLTPAILDWTIGAVPDAPTTYGGISLETDNDGRLHAGFVYDVYDYPYYARFGFGGNLWSGQAQLEPENYTLYPVSLAVNPKSNTPQVAFANNLDQLVVTALTCLPSLPCLWFPATADEPPDLDGKLTSPSFTIDSTGTRILAYDYYSPAQGKNGLKLMEIEGVTKTSRMIDTTTGRVDSTSLALRPGDVPAIAYHLPALGQIKVAWGPYGVFLPLIKR